MRGWYPLAPRSDDLELIAGLSFPDPFRPLEDGRDAAVIDWQRAQAELADAYIAQVPGVDELRARVSEYLVERLERALAMPRFAGGRWFRTQQAPGAAHHDVVVGDKPVGECNVVFQAEEHIDTDGRAPFVSWLSPSPDGSLVALGVCYDGSEANTIRIVDADSGMVLDDRPAPILQDGWMGGAQWFPDSSGFFFVALQDPNEKLSLRIFRHEIGAPVRNGPEPVPLIPGQAEKSVGVFISRDGRWVVASQNITRPKPVAVLDLHDGDGEWRPFITGLDASIAGHVIGDEFIAVTDYEAQRGQLVGIPLTAEAGDPSKWRVVVPESDVVLRGVIPVGDVLYLAELVDTYARVRIVDREGTEVGQVPLPGRGAVSEPGLPMMTQVPKGHPNEYIFAFASPTQSWGIYRHRPGAETIDTVQEPEITLDAVVDDFWAMAADGTRLPYHLVRRPDVSTSEPQPTLITAYGAFNTPATPSWPRAMAAFVDAGGFLVFAHLRGGGEFGLAWWEDGRFRKKQNTFADLYAIVEDLIARGRATPDRLAVTGASGGGHLTGVAVTQRPELWRAAVPFVPFFDLLGGCRDTYGRAVVASEFGDPDDPEEVARLATLSPYQLVKDGTPYPAVYIVAGETDPRCPPWHARKLAARLQEATSSDRPVFVRVLDNVGHGWATPQSVVVDCWTAAMAFTMDQLGMDARSALARSNGEG